MADKIVELNEFISGTGANAIKMNQNFNTIKTTVNDIIDDVATVETEVDEANAKFDKLLASVFIGQIIPLCRSDYPSGVLPCNGGEYTRATFPTFYSNFLLTGKILTCSYDVYAEEIATNGVCGKFALDAINEKFKTPTLNNGILLASASSSSEAGVYFEEGLPDFDFGFNVGMGYSIATNGYINAEPLGSGTVYPYGANGTNSTYGFYHKQSNYSDIYGASDHVTPRHVRYNYGVVVANITDDISEIAWNEIITELSNKLNKPTITTDTTSTAPVIANLANNTVRHYTQALTSLTITAYETSDISSTIWFEAGAGFSLNFTVAPLGYIPSVPIFETGKKYVMTMNNGYVIIGAVA